MPPTPSFKTRRKMATVSNIKDMIVCKKFFLFKSSVKSSFRTIALESLHSPKLFQLLSDKYLELRESLLVSAVMDHSVEPSPALHMNQLAHWEVLELHSYDGSSVGSSLVREVLQPDALFPRGVGNAVIFRQNLFICGVPSMAVYPDIVQFFSLLVLDAFSELICHHLELIVIFVFFIREHSFVDPNWFQWNFRPSPNSVELEEDAGLNFTIFGDISVILLWTLLENFFHIVRAVGFSISDFVIFIFAIGSIRNRLPFHLDTLLVLRIEEVVHSLDPVRPSVAFSAWLFLSPSFHLSTLSGPLSIVFDAELVDGTVDP